MKKRMIALALSVLMLISLLPAQALAEGIIPWYPNADTGSGYNSNISGEAIFNAMMKQEEPDSFSEDTLTPYGTQKDEAFTILEKAEVFEYVANGGTTKASTFHDNLTENRYAVTGSSTYDMMSDLEGSIPGGLRFAQGVAFDPTGSGRRDHVAIIGFRYDGTNSSGAKLASFHLYIVDAESKKTVKHMTLSSGSAERYGNFINELTVVDSGNFVQITAGDYNGDGCDSLVFYDGLGLYEVSYASSTFSYKRIDNTSNGKSYVNDAYKGSKLSGSWQLRNQLCMALASGDVNGDGIDDLAVLSYTGDISSNYVSAVGNTTCIPQLSVGYGVRDTKKAVADLSIDKTSVGTKQSSGATNTLACPGIAVGDIDGDGKNEIIAAGYLNKSKTTDVVVVDDSKSANPVAYTYYKTSGAGNLRNFGGVRELARAKTSPIAKDDSLREPEYLFQQLSVECVALEGMHTQEYVFLSGWFYCLDDAGNLQSIASNTIEKYQTGDFPNLFNELQTSVDTKDVDEVFIYSASVGNVFGSTTGKEAILFVVGYKTHTDANKEGSYHFKQCVYYDRGRTSANDMKTETVWFSTFCFRTRPMEKLTGDDEIFFASGNLGSPSVLLIAVDYGTDSVVGRYSGKAYAYTDPTPVAFLQAAPYFSELEAGNSSTQYSYSEGYRITTGTSEEVSYNVGFASEVEAGPIKSSMEVGVAYELNQEFTKSIDKTYTTTFEANDQNQVILRQTLMYYYFYDVQVYKDGKYEYLEDTLIISAPQYPVLTSLSMDQYNDFATAYNNAIAASTSKDVDESHKMELITDDLKEKYFLNNEGNPFAYARSAADYTYNGSPGWDLSQAKVGDTDTWMKLSHAGGTQTQTYSVTLEEEKTKTVAAGCYANMSLMAGGGSDILNVSAYAGITAEYERLKGSSISKASMTSTETSGTVQNLSADLTDYGFNWKLIGWKTDDLFVGVPFVGYAVKDQKDLPKAVDDLKASYSDGKVILTFTAPTADPGRMETTHFYAYDDLHDRYVGACSNSYGPNGDKVERSITIDVSGYDAPGATFTVIPYREDKMGGGIGGTRGMPSNEVYCLFAMSAKEVNALIQDLKDKINALTGALEEQGSDFETKLAELIAAYKKADEALKSQVDQEQEAARKALSDAMAAADKALKEAIDKVNADLSAAIEKLSQDTDSAIADLTNAYLSADALLKANIDSLSGKLSALEQTVNEADDALQAAIDQVRTDLSDAIENLRNASEEALAQAITDLTEAFTSADTLLKADIDSLSEALAELEQTMMEADAALLATIQKVQADLAAAKKELEAAMAEEVEQLNSKIDTLNAALEAAYKLADEMLTNKINDLSQQLDDLNAKHQADMDALFAELEALKAQIAEQDAINSVQQEKMDTTRIITIVGLCIGIVSLLGNAALLVLLLKKKSSAKV